MKKEKKMRKKKGVIAVAVACTLSTASTLGAIGLLQNSVYAETNDQAMLESYVDMLAGTEGGWLQSSNFDLSFIQYGNGIFHEPPDYSSGLLGTRIQDFDNDGAPELLALVLNREDTVSDREYHYFSVSVQMYERQDYLITKADEFQIFNESLFGYGTTEESGVFLTESNGKIFICGSAYYSAWIGSDGISYESFVCTYENGSFQMQYTTGGRIDGPGIMQEEDYYQQDAQEMAAFLDTIGLRNEAAQVRENYDQRFAFVDKQEDLIFLVEADNTGRTDQYWTTGALADLGSITGSLTLYDKYGNILNVSDTIVNAIPSSENTEDSWKQPYISYVQNADASNELGVYSYMLVDINGDAIPELYIDYGISAYGSELLTYANGSMVSMNLAVWGLNYIEGENLILSSGGSMDVYYDKIYTIENGTFVQIHDGSWGAEDNSNLQFDENGNIQYVYSWDGVSMSQEEYTAALNTVFDPEKAISASTGPYYNCNGVIDAINNY
ncbi:MAG: hypothetical protein LUG62_09880 [Clostridiales bacterium]|nr:hypothetical protein [Clostridiales bacterium]